LRSAEPLVQRLRQQRFLEVQAVVNLPLLLLLAVCLQGWADFPLIPWVVDHLAAA
jgi:hypothetical protein